MNNIIKKFEAFDSSYYSFLDTKPTYEKIAVFEKQDHNTIVYADRAVQVRFLNFTAAWQAATEQSQKEIAEKDELLYEQKCAIKGLNMCIGGEDSLTTNNLRACGEYLDNEKCLLEMVRELKAREKELVKLVLTTGLRAYPNKTKHQIQDEITNMLANVRG